MGDPALRDSLAQRADDRLLADHLVEQLPSDNRVHLTVLLQEEGATTVRQRNDEHCPGDVSADALAIARENVRQASLGNVNCIEGNWTEPVAGRRFNIIVSNPPYVCAGDDALQALMYEPLSALVSGEDGLDAIRILARDCGALLEADGLLLIEHGAEQRDAVASILAANGWSDITCHNDLAGIPRVTAARRDGK